MSGKEKKKNNLIKSTVALLEAQARKLEAQKQAYTEKIGRASCRERVSA